ncbi:hypothetical protein SAMN04489710_105338 [Paracidovorax konjaci]|uniref:Uncharacterized protein n=1 Tax=Paracidovorax konjaci TaxID=32040 RepID=A0A1I1UW70_9BURK|nr:hypothetical protein SAMN04489710_105338 [Paracidovorax konjaci]
MLAEQLRAYPQPRADGRSCYRRARAVTRPSTTGFRAPQVRARIGKKPLVHTKWVPLLLFLWIDKSLRGITEHPDTGAPWRVGKGERHLPPAGWRRQRLAGCGKGGGLGRVWRTPAGLARVLSRAPAGLATECRARPAAPTTGRVAAVHYIFDSKLSNGSGGMEGFSSPTPAAGPSQDKSGDISRTTGRLSTAADRFRDLSPPDGQRQPPPTHRVGTQPSPLSRNGKIRLSTERGGAYYYDYVFIKTSRRKQEKSAGASVRAGRACIRVAGQTGESQGIGATGWARGLEIHAALLQGMGGPWRA